MEEGKRFSGRSNILIAIFAVCLICFTGILYNAQVVHGTDYLARSNTQVTTTKTVETSRGIITDRNGKVLVSNQEIYTISFHPGDIPADPDAGLNQKQNTAQSLLRLIQLCQSYGVTWNDGLPLTTSKPFGYTLSTAANTQRTRFRDYLSDRGWSDTALTSSTAFPLMTEALQEKLAVIGSPLSANRLVSLMRTDFDIPAEFTDEEARLVCGVLYELALRTLPQGKTVNVPYVFAEDVPVEVISILHDGNFAGVTVGIKSVRQYNTDYAAHILGRVGDIDSTEERTQLNAPYNTAREAGEDTSALHYYQWDDKVGKDGVEKAFETYLCGLEGKRLITTDRDGKITSEIYSIEPKPGDTVSLTIDIDFQAQVEAILARSVEAMNEEDGDLTRGAAAVSVADGGVLALGNYPTYSQRTYLEDYTALAENIARPFNNRALTGVYAPGSTFKPCTAVAALEAGATDEDGNTCGIITPDTVIQTKGIYTAYKDYQPRCWYYKDYGGIHGRINVSQALFHSCNYFFFDLAYRMGINVLDEYATAFGLGQPTGIEIYEKTGTLAGPEYSKSQGLNWVGGNTLAAAIGQSDNTFTPLQLANYIAALVRGGDRYAAHVLQSIQSYDGSETVYEYEPEILSTVEMADSTLEAVKSGMGDLVLSGSISGYFRECVVSAGAKTGSAQLGDGGTDGVFVCFAPFDDPEIAVALVIEKGVSGSAVAPAAVEILNAYFSAGDTGSAVVPEGTLLP